jgi:hypothetical protein
MHTVTLGGLTVGMSILTIQGIRWWTREGHKAAALVPILLSLAYGILAILAGGGALGGLAGGALWGSNGLGDLSLVYGVGGTTSNITRSDTHVLTPGGYAVVVLLTVALICLCIWAKKVPVWKVLLGVLAGICLGLVGTIAGAAAVPLASGVNFAGSIFTAMR